MSSTPASRWADRSDVRPDRQDLFLRIQNVIVYVRDQDRSLRFYVDRLGFRLVIDATLPSGERWIAVAPPDGSAILALVAPSRAPTTTGTSASSPA